MPSSEMRPPTTSRVAWLATPAPDQLPEQVAAEIGPIAERIGFVPNIARLLAVTPRLWGAETRIRVVTRRSIEEEHENRSGTPGRCLLLCLLLFPICLWSIPALGRISNPRTCDRRRSGTRRPVWLTDLSPWVACQMRCRIWVGRRRVSLHFPSARRRAARDRAERTGTNRDDRSCRQAVYARHGR